MRKFPLTAPLIIIFAVITLSLQAQTLPEVKVVNEFGKQSLLKDYMKGTTLLVMGYYHCEHMCHFVIKDLTKKLTSVDPYPNVIYFGIDENEGPRDALHLKKRIFGPFKSKWSFLLSQKKDIRRLAEFLNFQMKRDPATNTITHELGLYAFKEDKLIRKLPGIDFSAADLESTGEEKKGILEPLKKFCSQYDPRQSKYGPLIMKSLSVSSLFFLILCAMGLRRLMRSGL